MDDSYCEPKIDLPRWAEQCAAPGGVVRGRSEGDVTQKPEERRGDTWVRPTLGQPANQSLAFKADAKPLVEIAVTQRPEGGSKDTWVSLETNLGPSSTRNPLSKHRIQKSKETPANLR